MTPLEAKSLAVDIDHTLCRCSGPENYQRAEPIAGAREALSKLRSEGWVIILHTARHFNQWQVTVDWLRRHGFEYDQIVFGKPPARFYLDDRAITFEGDWDALYRRLRSQDAGHAENCWHEIRTTQEEPKGASPRRLV